MSRVRAALGELAAAEIDLQRAWAAGAVAITNGTLSEPARDAFHSVRDQVHALETAMYTIIQRATANLPGFRLDEWIPAPTRMPNLPQITGAQAPLAVAGLGVPVPPAVWAAIVIVAIVEVAAIAWAVTHLAEVTADFLVRLYQVRQNTLRYESQLGAQQARFNACVRAGRSFTECGSAFTLPTPPQEDTRAPQRSNALEAGLWAVGALVVAGGGVWAFRKYASKS